MRSLPLPWKSQSQAAWALLQGQLADKATTALAMMGESPIRNGAVFQMPLVLAPSLPCSMAAVEPFFPNICTMLEIQKSGGDGCQRVPAHVSGGRPVPVGSSKEKGMEASCRREGAACGVAGQEDPPRWRRNVQRRRTAAPKGRTGAMKGA